LEREICALHDDQWFSTCPVREIEEKFMEDGAVTGDQEIEGGDDDERNDWDNGLATTRRGLRKLR
jgi:hypothetical protein